MAAGTGIFAGQQPRFQRAIGDDDPALRERLDGADERLERVVERMAGAGRGVAGAGDVSPPRAQPGRQGVADGFEGGAMVARDHELGERCR